MSRPPDPLTFTVIFIGGLLSYGCGKDKNQSVLQALAARAAHVMLAVGKDTNKREPAKGQQQIESWMHENIGPILVVCFK